MNLKATIKILEHTIAKNSPTILSGMAMAGTIITGVLAVKAGKDAQKKHEDLIVNKPDATKTDIILAEAPCYILPTIWGGVTIFCIFGANKVNAKRIAVLGSMLAASNQKVIDYKKAIDDMLPKSKAIAIKDAVLQKEVDRASSKEDTPVVFTGNGEYLCYDPQSGRFFRSDMESVRRAVNNLNEQLLREMFVTLNDFYYELKIPPIKLGNELGWNSQKGLADIRFGTMTNDKGEPCLTLDYDVTQTGCDFRTLQ